MNKQGKSFVEAWNMVVKKIFLFLNERFRLSQLC